MKAILNHRVDGSDKRTMEALATMSIPSTKGPSIASAIQDELALLPDTQGDDDFRYAFCTIIMSQWSECVKQSYVSPQPHWTFRLMLNLLLVRASINSLRPAHVPSF